MTIKTVLGVLVVLAVTTMRPALAADSDLGSWIKGPDLGKAAEEVSVAGVDGKVYLVGGLDGWTPMGLLEELDPATGTWRSRAPMPLPVHHVGVVAIGNALYAFGGYKPPDKGRGWVPVANVWRYDPKADRWEPRAAMPTARGALAVAVHDGKGYAMGGSVLPAHMQTAPYPEFLHGGYHVNVSTVEVYDPLRDQWTTRAPMPTARNHFVAAALNGRIYAIGGRVGTSSARNGSSNIAVTEEYDPATDIWRSVPTMPTARSGMASALYGGRLIVIGGESVKTTYAEVEEFDPVKRQWRTLKAMTKGRHGLGAVTVGNKIYVMGGGHLPAGDDSTALVEIFMPPAPR
jgi:N-acetylneuraminic acid mutarotase